MHLKKQRKQFKKTLSRSLYCVTEKWSGFVPKIRDVSPFGESKWTVPNVSTNLLGELFLLTVTFLKKNLKFLSTNPSAHTLPETFTRGLCGLLKLTVSKTESNPYTTPKYCFSLSKKRLQGPLDGGVILSSNTKPGSYLMKSTTRITT